MYTIVLLVVMLLLPHAHLATNVKITLFNSMLKSYSNDYCVGWLWSKNLAIRLRLGYDGVHLTEHCFRRAMKYLTSPMPLLFGRIKGYWSPYPCPKNTDADATSEHGRIVNSRAEQPNFMQGHISMTLQGTLTINPTFSIPNGPVTSHVPLKVCQKVQQGFFVNVAS